MKKDLLTRMWFLLILAGCQSTVKSENMLEKRSDYDDKYYSQSTSEDAKQFLVRSNKSKVKYTDIRIYPHELPNGELFLGGWVRVSVTNEKFPRFDPDTPPMEQSMKNKPRTRK